VTNEQWRKGATPNEAICNVRLHNPADFSGEDRNPLMSNTDKPFAIAMLQRRRADAVSQGGSAEIEVGEIDVAIAALSRPTPLEDRDKLIERLQRAVVALANGADKCAKAPHFIVQPFLAIYRGHGKTIAEARKTLTAKDGGGK
jgi:hypothetical protein